jgi:hypothetical protein
VLGIWGTGLGEEEKADSLVHQFIISILYVFNYNTGHRWLTPIILVTWEAEIRKTEVRSQPGQIVQETLSQKCPT